MNLKNLMQLSVRTIMDDSYTITEQFPLTLMMLPVDRLDKYICDRFKNSIIFSCYGYKEIKTEHPNQT